MNKKKVIAYVIGVSCAIAAALGMALLVSSKPLTISAAIVTICLSLASGLLIPNPISLFGLIAGICMLIFPAWIVGIIIICIGIAVAVANLYIAKKALKL